jgi:hypothetical protein
MPEFNDFLMAYITALNLIQLIHLYHEDTSSCARLFTAFNTDAFSRYHKTKAASFSYR